MFYIKYMINDSIDKSKVTLTDGVAFPVAQQ